MLEAFILTTLIVAIPTMLWWGPAIWYHVKIKRAGSPIPIWLILHYQISAIIVFFGIFIENSMGIAVAFFPPILPVFVALMVFNKPALSYIVASLLLSFTIGFGTPLIAAFRFSSRWQHDAKWYIALALLIGAGFSLVSTELYLKHKIQQTAAQQGIELIHQSPMYHSLRIYPHAFRNHHAWGRDTCLFYHWSYAEKRFVPTPKYNNRNCE